MQINLMTMKKGFQGSNRKADFPGNPLFVKGGVKSLMTQRCHSSRRGNPGPNFPFTKGNPEKQTWIPAQEYLLRSLRAGMTHCLLP